MKKYLLATVTLACLLSLTSLASAQDCSDIDVIQQYNAATGAPESPCANQFTTIYGKVYVLKGTYNSGTHYIMGETGGIQVFNSNAPALTYGDSVEVTGQVLAFSGEIQISTSPTITKLSSGSIPDTTEVALADLVNPYDYEQVGNFISVTGTVADVSASGFHLHNGNLDSLYVYIDSDTQIDLSGVAVGDEYKVISPCVVFNGEIELKPRMQSDLIEDPYAPVVVSVNCIDEGSSKGWVPGSTTPITVEATIVDENPAKAVASAKLYFRNDTGDSIGAFTPINMTPVGGSAFRATIAAPHPDPYVHFYVEATDDQVPGKISTSPANAPDGWYECAIGFTTIYDVQYVDPNNDYQGSPYLGKTVNLKGIVTAGTYEASFAPSIFILQEYPDDYPEWNPNSGQFHGVEVYEGTASNFVLRGDEVEVAGHIDEYFGMTEMNPTTPHAVYVRSFNNDLPPASYVSTRTLADNTLLDGNGELGEAYESVWVRTAPSCVLDTLGFNTFIISDTCVRADSVEVNPEIDLVYQPTIGEVAIFEGFMEYEGGHFQVTPISDEFIVSGLTGYFEPEQPLPDVRPAGGFVSILPNPFNPRTEIRFVLNRDNLAQLNIYDIRGQLVRSLVNDRLPAMEHVYVWDGTDSNGSSVGSGTYFARLRVGLEVMQVRKLTLIK